ncbi:hypothetical protein CSAL01_05901 [Colletotrichum salicis]|uniref:2EXR domain-containing protein n=1 Tax=Colletotrichum salicis TaxID=1209931 RepID=A0A135UBH8_9PEZI|nr:hypothetical protein CSAL01_05901 [Colletotrichum salicis]
MGSLPWFITAIVSCTLALFFKYKRPFEFFVQLVLVYHLGLGAIEATSAGSLTWCGRKSVVETSEKAWPVAGVIVELAAVILLSFGEEDHSHLVYIGAIEFPQFKKFPTEIRRKVWLSALPSPQIYEPDNTAEYWYFDKPTRFLHEHSPPRVREVCKEAYEACMSVGHFTFGCFGNTNIRDLWFNDTQDAIYYATLEKWYQTELKASKKTIISIEVALDVFLETGFENESFAACRHLVVALYIDSRCPIASVHMDELPRKLPVCRAVRDDDIITQTLGVKNIIAARNPELDGRNYLTWAELKDMLLKTREGKILANADKPGIYKGPLILEAVEAFRKGYNRG